MRIGRYIAGIEALVQNTVLAKCLNVFAKWKDHSEEQNNTYMAIQMSKKHFVSPLNSHLAIHRC